MKITMIVALALLTASGTALAQTVAPAAADTMAATAVHAAPACTGAACNTPATANHAINEKGTPGTKCSKPATPPPSTGGGCNNPCTCPPPN